MYVMKIITRAVGHLLVCVCVCIQLTDIYDALKDSALLDSIRQNGSEGDKTHLLDLKMSDGGDNWSSGQKQLLVCIYIYIYTCMCVCA